MTHAQTKTRFALMAIALGLIGVVATAAEKQTVPPAAQLLPPDTFFYLEIDDCQDAWAKFQQTGYYQLYQDPAMQPFINKFRGQIEEKWKEMLHEISSDLDLDQPLETIPKPQGRVVVAARFVEREVVKPTGYDENYHPTGEQKVVEPVPHFVFLADFGDQFDAAWDIIEKAAYVEVEAGETVLRTEKVRGIEVYITEDIEDEEEQDDPYYEYDQIDYDEVWAQAPCYAHKDNCLLVSTDFELIKDVIQRWDVGGPERLKDTPAYRAWKRHGQSGDIQAVADIGRLIAYLKKDLLVDVEEDEEAQQLQTFFDESGFNDLGYFSAAFKLAPNPAEYLRVQYLLQCHREPHGLLDILLSKPTAYQHIRKLKGDTAVAVMMTMDVPALFDEILRLVQLISGFDPTPMIQGALAMTGEPGDGGRPPVDLRNDIIGPLVGPLMVVQNLEKPISADKDLNTVIGMGVRDPERLDQALLRVYKSFITPSNPDLMRELNGTNIYVIPHSGEMGVAAAMLGGVRMTDEVVPFYALAVVGEQLIFSNVDAVEQSIRDLLRSDYAQLGAAPLYRQATREVPAEVTLFSYEDSTQVMEWFWTALKASADENVDAGDLITGIDAFAFEMVMDELDFDFSASDFSLLPDFDSVRQYFGVETGYAVPIDRGMEFVGIWYKTTE